MEATAGLLRGRTAVVIGCGDIGRVIAATLHGQGASVIVWDRSLEVLDSVASDGLERLSTKAMDVASWDEVQVAAGEAIESLSWVDIVVNSVGIATFAPVATLEVEDWKRTIDVNLTAVFLACKAFVPHMVARGQGSIVNISSIGGLRGEPEFSHYSAAKFGVIGFTQSLAREVGEYGIRVNAVCPGAVRSTMNTATMARDARRAGIPLAAVEAAIVAKTALRRLAEPADVANAVLYLASDMASFVTGESVAVTGGIF